MVHCGYVLPSTQNGSETLSWHVYFKLPLTIHIEHHYIDLVLKSEECRLSCCKVRAFFRHGDPILYFFLSNLSFCSAQHIIYTF